MPQTEEHVAILELLDIRSGLVAVTKADLVDGETLELAQLELADHLEATPARRLARRRRRQRQRARARRAARGARRGAGGRAGRARHRAPAPLDRPGLLRAGSGTVVTGTLTGGALVGRPGSRRGTGHARRSDPPHRVARRAPRARRAGSRVALNLAGVEHDAVRRGRRRRAALANGRHPRRSTSSCGPRLITSSPGAVRSTHTSDRANTRPRFASSMARSTRPATPSADCSCRSAFRSPLAIGSCCAPRPAAPRPVARRCSTYAPTRRIADAPRRLALPLPERVLAARPWATAAELGPLAGVADGDEWARALCAEGRAANVGGWIVSPAALEAVREQATAAVAAATDPAGVDLAALASQCGIDAPKLRAALADDAAARHRPRRGPERGSVAGRRRSRGARAARRDDRAAVRSRPRRRSWARPRRSSAH